MTQGQNGKVALLWRGDREARRNATAENSRFGGMFEALSALGIHAQPAVYMDDMVEEVREQLLRVDGVLVWVNPISDGHNRVILDALLREVAAKGIWASAHPDVILKMGVKQVLYRTKSLGWGSDTYVYEDARTFRAEFLTRLRAAGPRVLKQNRGNGGQGIWKVELLHLTSEDAASRLPHAAAFCDGHQDIEIPQRQAAAQAQLVPRHG